MLLLFAWYFSGILTVEAAVPFTLLPALGTHFLLVDCLVQSKLSVRACLIVFFFYLGSLFFSEGRWRRSGSRGKLEGE